jgi:hypothetical protein
MLAEERDRTYLPRFAPRPDRFRLDARALRDGCAGQWIPFRDGRRAFYLQLFAAPDAPAATLRELERVANSLRVRPRPRPG